MIVRSGADRAALSTSRCVKRCRRFPRLSLCGGLRLLTGLVLTVAASSFFVVEVGAQYMTRHSGVALDLPHPFRRDALPLADCLVGQAE